MSYNINGNRLSANYRSITSIGDIDEEIAAQTTKLFLSHNNLRHLEGIG
jgi:hypothetical protein